MDDPAYVQSEQVEHDVDAKMDEGKAVLRRHRNEFDAFFNQANEFVIALSHDRTIHRLSVDTQKLVQRLFLDDEGRPTLKSGVLLDLRNVYDPEAMRGAGFRYVSIGRP